MAIKTEIVWHKASEELPEKSGDYLVLKVYDHSTVLVGNLPYSKSANRFNQTDGEEHPHYPVKVNYWAEMQRLLEVSADG